MCAVISLVIALVFAAEANAEGDVCYNPKTDFYPLLGTRTAYELIHGHEKLRPISDSTCQPLQIWALIRHGTKYPENKDMPKMMNLTKFRDQILENHKNGAGQLCAKDLESLGTWKLDPNINEKTNEELSAQGEKDLLELGKRLKKAFPELFNLDTFTANNFIFQSTNRQRTKFSKASFVKGMQYEYESVQFKTTLVDNNSTLLLPHKNCPAWNKEYDEQKSSSEWEKFKNGSEIKSVLKTLTKRLGFQYDLDYNTVSTAYDMCRYEVAWYPEKVSTWCSIFKQDDLKIFEYNEDLDYYYCCGPGREMAAKLGCNLMADMYSHFKALVSGETKDQPKGIFYFAHTVSLQILMAALKIGKEKTPFTYTTYATSQNRTYHVSKLGPFATNLLAVFYKCSGSQPEHRITLHVAESPAPVDGCPNGICDWEFVKNEYGPAAESCSLKFCRSNAKPSSDITNIG